MCTYKESILKDENKVCDIHFVVFFFVMLKDWNIFGQNL